jgi:membrane associated rhomboid family serine protease
MNGSRAQSFTFPRPGPTLWFVLGAMTALGVFGALSGTWAPGGAIVFDALRCQLNVAWSQPWRLITSGLLTSPEHWSHLLFSLAGLYFLGAPLERRWGGWRFARFLALSTIMGNLATIAADRLVPAYGQERFHPDFIFGPAAVIAAVAVAWAREYPDSTVNLFLFLPMQGKVLLWITVGFCVLDLVYPAAMPEGVVAPFGGILAGLAFGGSPSLSRTAWLRLRLALLRRRSGGNLRSQDLLGGPTKPARRPRTGGGPPLRVVPGGLDDALKKRNPPKDKRYFN